MYIVDYTNGWDLISTDHRVPMIIASSEIGYFDKNDVNMPPAFKAYLNGVAEELYQVKHTDNKEGATYGLWQTVSIQNDEVDLKKIEIAPHAINLKPGSGHWELIETSEPELTVSIVNKLTVTKWNQVNPWNTCIPYSIENPTIKGPAGCVAIAIGQYLYFLHYKYNKPSSTVTAATYNASTNQYTYSGNSTTVWDEMALNSSGSNAAKEKTAIFIGYVGQCVNMEYHEAYGETNYTKSLSFINSQTGDNYYVTSIDYNYVENELNAGHPVLASAYGDDNNGHAFIIDAKEKRTITVTSRYGWVGTDNLGNDSNERDPEGNITGYSFFYENESQTASMSFKMNWGGGSYDEVLFGASDSNDWNVGGVNFKNKREIVKH